MRDLSRTEQQPFWDPYLSGIGLGLVLLASFVFAERGIGVSGALDRMVLSALQRFEARELINEWIVVEVLGLICGAALSAWLGGRFRMGVDRGPRIAPVSRLLLASLGGVLVGFGSRFAHGCTSGQALSGGALLSVGSWTFMIALFASAYLFAGLFRRAWR